MKKPREGRSPQETMLFSLLLAIGVIGVVGYLLLAQPTSTDTDSLSRYEYEGDSVSASDSLADIPAMDASDSEDTASSEETEEDAQEEDSEEDAADAEEDLEDAEDAIAASEPAEFAAPTGSGSVSRPYSVDALSYDATMKDWRTHAATDFAGESGDAVTAFTDGTVVEIGEDALRGTYLILNHAEDRQSCYTGITDIAVKEGDAVTCGQQIAKLGEPMPAEAEQGVHLHLELTQNGEPEDAETLLTDNSSADEDA
jgi:murein DD-endopeptidase MepM/ murein hydrolase activator NlpD